MVQPPSGRAAGSPVGFALRIQDVYGDDRAGLACLVQGGMIREAQILPEPYQGDGMGRHGWIFLATKV
jgi:hypothetical protein